MKNKYIYLILTVLLPFLINIFIEHKIERIILPLRLEVAEIKANHSFWIKQIAENKNLL